LKWFAQNTRIEENEKIVQIPIGLDYHTILRNPNNPWRQPDEGYLPAQQEEILIDIVKKSIPFFERIPKIYINYNINNDRFNQRQLALDTIPNELTSKNTDFIPRTNTWQNMSNHTFVLCPTGMGLDCHRTWEALILGCIPIVCVKEFKTLFEDLPVLLVNDWSEVTQELLDKTIEDFKNRTFNENKLTLEYWKSIINNNI
jgi:hypothetical protein